MFVTQDVVMRLFFCEKKIINNTFSIPMDSSIIIAPTHRSRWDGLILTMAIGRRVTKKDCLFMVTNSEMEGIQGWFLKRLGCFSINQIRHSLSALLYAVTKFITIVPIGIAYSEVSPKFRSKVALCFGKPLIMNEKLDLSIHKFNKVLYEKMTEAEKIALKNVGR